MGRQNEPEKGILFFLGKGTVLGKGLQSRYLIFGQASTTT